jgi:phage-related minor tail protein
MLELSALHFSVNTTELVEAKKRIDDLVVSQQKLSSSMQKQASGSTSASGGLKAAKTQVDLLEKLDLLYKDLAQGATRWEASQLRAARSLNLPLEEVQQKLINIRKLTRDPFDSAIGSVRSITQHFEELQNRITLTNQGIAFTTKQLKEFSRIPFEIEGQVRSAGMNPKEGAGLAEYDKRVEEAERAYVDAAKQVNVLADAEKQRINVVKQAAVAEKYLASEMQRVDSILTELNRNQASGTSISERHAASVARYANSLKSAGVSGQVAAAQLETYRGKIQQIEALENKRAQNRLANALAPQISDVAVSIAGGMPLHLVMMQQGLQIRDLIGQSGVAAEKLQETFRAAGKNMVTSIGGTIAAVGQLAYGTLVDAGAAAVNFAGKLPLISGAMQDLATKTNMSEKALTRLTTVANTSVGIGLLGITAVIGAAVYETIKLIGANNDLARELAMTGNVFGVTYANSQKYIEGLTGVGVSTRNAMSIMQQMSAAGGMTANQIQLVGKTASDMQKYAGVAIADTVKEFAKFADDPVKALSELQIKTGQVSPGVIKLAEEMKKQGDTAGAVGLAMQALAGVHATAVQKMQDDLNPLTTAWISFFDFFGRKYSEMSDRINRGLGGGSAVSRLENQLKGLQSRVPNISRDLFVDTKAEEDRLKEQIRLLKMSDDAQITRSQQQSREETERVEIQKIRLQYLSKEEEQQKRLKEINTARDRLSKTSDPMSKAAYDEKYKEIFKDNDAQKEANKQLKAKESILDQIEAAYNKATSAAKEYNEIEAKLAEWRDSSAGKKASPALIKEAEALAASRMQGLKDAKQITANKEAETYAQEKLSDAYLNTVGTVKQLTNIEKAWLDLQNDPKFKAASAEKQMQIKAEAEAYTLQAKAVIESNKALEHAKELRAIAGQREDVAFERSQLGMSGRASTEAKAKYDYEKQLAKNNADYLSEVKKNYQIEDQAAYDAEMNRAREKYAALDQLAKDKYDKEVYAMSDMLQRQKNFDDVVKRGFEGMGDALIDFALTGKASFGDMIESMLLDLVKLEMRMQMMKLYEGGGSGGGILGSLLKAGASYFTGGASDVGTSMSQLDYATLSGFEGGGYTGSGMRIGGIDGKGGGLAILHPNETVIDHTKGQGMSANVQVNIINNSTSQVTQKESTDSRGNRKVEVIVGDMTAGEVQRSGSAVQRGIGSTFGMRPALIQR